MEPSEDSSGEISRKAECPFCCYVAMIHSEKWDDPNEAIDCCKHCGQVNEYSILFEAEE